MPSSRCRCSTNSPSWLDWKKRVSSPSSARRGDSQLELLEADRPVWLCVAPAELVEVDTVHDLDAVADGSCRQLSHGGDQSREPQPCSPGVGAPGLSSSTNGTGPRPQPLLVARGGHHDRVRVGVVQRDRQPPRGEQLAHLVRAARPGPESRSAASNPSADGLAVAVAGVAGRGLDRMGRQCGRG